MTPGITRGEAIIPRGGTVLIIGVGAVGMPAGTIRGMTRGGDHLGDGAAGMPVGIIILIIGVAGTRIIITHTLRHITGTDVPDIREARDGQVMPAICGATGPIPPDVMPGLYEAQGVMPDATLPEMRPLCVVKT